MKILIVEDEKHLAEGLKFNLEADGFETEIAADGEEALELLDRSETPFDAIVLDVMMPRVDGFTVARTLRERSDFTPILMLTALGKPDDVLQGFEAGADDYLPKPFELNIFLARINGLIRRREWFLKAHQPEETDDLIEVNNHLIDFENLEIRSETETIQLTLMEAKLLRFLIDKGGAPVSRKTILEQVWDLHEETDTRAIDNFIVRLRKYLEDDPANPKIVLTVRGIGYKFVSDD